MLPYRLLKTGMSVISKPAKLDFRPVVIQVESTNKCNLKCKFCQRDKMKAKLEHLPIDKFQFIIDHFRPRFITLSGDGEPLLNPDIFSIIQIAKKSGAKTNFATNGVLLEHCTESLIDARLDLLKISIDAASPDVYKRIRNVDKHRQIVEGIKKLQDIKRKKGNKKPQLRFNIVVCKENVEELAAIVRLARALEVPTVLFRTADVIGQEENFSTVLEGIIGNGHLLQAYQEALEVSKHLGVKTNLGYLIANHTNYKIRCSKEKIEEGINRKVYCLLPWISIYIKVNGDLTPCCPFSLGNVNTSFGNIYSQGVEGALNSKCFTGFREEMKKGEPFFKTCRFCFEAQTLSNFATNFKMLRHFFR